MPSIGYIVGRADPGKTEAATVKELFELNVEFEVRRRLGKADPVVTSNIIAYAHKLPPSMDFPGWDGLWEGYWATV